MPSLTYPSDIVRNDPDVGDDVFNTNGRLSSDVRSKPIARRLTYFKMGIIFRFFSIAETNDRMFTRGGLSINLRQLFNSVGELSSSELGERD